VVIELMVGSPLLSIGDGEQCKPATSASLVG
jgi:hypothetical protein